MKRDSSGIRGESKMIRDEVSGFAHNSSPIPRRASYTPEPEGLNGYVRPSKKRTVVKALKISAVALAVIIAVASIGGYFYWQSLKSTPQYSLALLIEAARNGDQIAVNQLIDTDGAVDDFVPQVTSKAIELYGRGLPPQTLTRIERLAEPLIPAVKDRAREELPRLIREKTSGFANVPFAAMVLGADRYLEIEADGAQSTVKSKLPEHGFEVLMTKSGDKWKIIGVRDEKLATAIAQKIGQEIIAIAKNGGEARSGSLRNVQEILKQAQDIFK